MQARVTDLLALGYGSRQAGPRLLGALLEGVPLAGRGDLVAGGPAEHPAHVDEVLWGAARSVRVLPFHFAANSLGVIAAERSGNLTGLGLLSASLLAVARRSCVRGVAGPPVASSPVACPGRGDPFGSIVLSAHAGPVSGRLGRQHRPRPPSRRVRRAVQHYARSPRHLAGPPALQAIIYPAERARTAPLARSRAAVEGWLSGRALQTMIRQGRAGSGGARACGPRPTTARLRLGSTWGTLLHAFVGDTRGDLLDAGRELGVVDER